MQKIKSFLKRLLSAFTKERKNTLGFSLIELLVVIAIIGVLAAVAIPAYNKYRVNAAQGALNSSAQSIAKGFSACLTLNTFDNCNELTEIDVSCADCDREATTTSGSWCVDLKKDVGGTTYMACVQTDGGTPTIIGNWPVTCSSVNVTYTCNTAMTGYNAPGVTCANLGCTVTATNPIPTTSSCTTNTTHNCMTANSGDQTMVLATRGQCVITTGVCQ